VGVSDPPAFRVISGLGGFTLHPCQQQPRQILDDVVGHVRGDWELRVHCVWVGVSVGVYDGVAQWVGGRSVA